MEQDATAPAAEPIGRRLLPPADHRLTWTAGVLLVLLGVGAAVANLRLPVLAFTAPGATVPSGWGDLREPGGLAYEQRLLVWPLAAYVLVGVCGALVAVRAHLRPAWVRRVRPLTAPALWALAFSGFLLALTGTRWLGFFLARRSEAGPALVRLDVVPYLNLAVGVVVLSGAAWGLVRLLRGAGGPARWAAWSAVAAASGLLLLPLLPFAHWPFGGGGVVRLDEFTLAALDAEASGRSAAPRALGRVRLVLWGALYASVAACLAWQVPWGPVPRVVVWLRHLAAANVLFVAAGAMFLVRFHRSLPALRPGVTAEPNPFPHLALLALGVLWWLQVRSLRRSA